MRDLLAIAVYLLALLVGVAIFNADQAWFNWGYAVWFLASFGLGLATGRPWFFLVPLVVAVPLGMAFGYSENHVGSDAPLVAVHAVAAAVPSAALVLLGAASSLRLAGSARS